MKTALRRNQLGTTAVLTLALFAEPTIGWSKAFLVSDSLIIEDANNTAATVAADIGDPSVFRYEPELTRAVVTRNLVIAGELALGGEAEWDGVLKHALVVELDVTECGSARIEVVRRSSEVGHLKLYRTKITATHREKDLDECKEANLLQVAGRLTMQDSTVTGNINVRFEPGAEVELNRSTVSFTRVSGMEMKGVSARDIRIADSSSLDNGLYGLSITRLLSSPLEVARTVLRGLAADVFVSGNARVILTDCDFKTVRFARRTGAVRRRWTVTCHLPAPGAEVVAKSLPGTGRSETVRATANDRGVCQLVLSEYEASPGSPLPTDGRNKFTPHQLTVYDKPGGRPLYRLTGLHVFMRGQEVWFK